MIIDVACLLEYNRRTLSLEHAVEAGGFEQTQTSNKQTQAQIPRLGNGRSAASPRRIQAPASLACREAKKFDVPRELRHRRSSCCRVRHFVVAVACCALRPTSCWTEDEMTYRSVDANYGMKPRSGMLFLEAWRGCRCRLVPPSLRPKHQ